VKTLKYSALNVHTIITKSSTLK